MKQLSRIFVATALILSNLFVVGSCGPKEEPVPDVIGVESIVLNREQVTLDIGATAKLTATVKPVNANDKTVTWESDNPSVATIDQNGKITAVKDGTATITAKAGGRTVTCPVVVKPDPEAPTKATLMKLYDTLGGPGWTKKDGWGTDKPLNDWAGVTYDKTSGALRLQFAPNTGLKGEIPDCIGDLKGLEHLTISEPGLTGTLPASFGKLTSLAVFWLENTSMTSLPDIFSDLKSLRQVVIQSNLEMTGPLPESLCSSPKMNSVTICNNFFTGSIPASWIKLMESASHFTIENNCLSGSIPEAILNSDKIDELLDCFLIQKKGYGFDISGIDISGEPNWPSGKITAMDNRQFTFKDVVAKNKYTVFLIWAPWCPHSKGLVPQLRDYYDIYHDKGFEIIATVEMDQNGSMWYDYAGQEQEIEEKGYGKWLNYYYPSLNPNGYIPEVPHAEVYDQEGNILFSSIAKYPDPERGRFSRTASTHLMDFLEAVVGPSGEPDEYISTDFSKDGEVAVLQKATVGKGINIVFLGDAFTDRDMDEGGLYDTVMNEAMEHFFAIEPYKTFRDRFNVYSVKAVSDREVVATGASTAFSTYYGSDQYVNGDQDKCYEYAQKVPGINSRDNLLVTVIINAKRLCGTAHMAESTQSSVAFVSYIGSDPEAFASTLQHEAGGHGFAFLDDEYVRENDMRPSQEYIDNRNRLYNQYGWFANVDFTDDPEKVKWSFFLSDERYKNQVGIYEGASSVGIGAYRPTKSSLMNNQIEGFNAPSRWAIFKRIMELSGEEASFEKFLEYDAINRRGNNTGTPGTRSSGWIPDAPVEILP